MRTRQEIEKDLKSHRDTYFAQGEAYRNIRLVVELLLDIREQLSSQESKQTESKPQ